MSNWTVYTWKDVEESADCIIRQMYADMWRPDYIVGINNSGSVLATVLSHKLNIKMHSLDVADKESNLWMAEDAFGIVPDELNDTKYSARWDPYFRKKILLVDSTNKSSTFNWIINDWKSGCFPKEDALWDSVWNKNVKFATMVNYKGREDEEANYAWHEISGRSGPRCFPWEFHNHSTMQNY